MNRRGFLKRMAFAALATVFLDLPLPTDEPAPEPIRLVKKAGPVEFTDEAFARLPRLQIKRSRYVPNGTAWVQDGTLFVNPGADLEELLR